MVQKGKKLMIKDKTLYEDAPPKTTSSQLTTAIGKKPIRMENRQVGSIYGFPTKPSFAWASVYTTKDEIIIKPITDFDTCRETSCDPISSKDTGTMQEWGMVESKDRDTQKKWSRTFYFDDYVNSGRPTVFLLKNMDLKKLQKGLKVIHHYERIARAGKTTFFPVNHAYYKTTSIYSPGRGMMYTNSDSKFDLNLVVAPEFWHHSVPMASVFLLLIRIIACKSPCETETVHQYLVRMCSCRGLGSRDRAHLKALYKYKFIDVEVDMITVMCRRWRLLSKAMEKHTEPYCGYWGSHRLHLSINRWQQVIKSTKTNKNTLAISNAYRNIPGSYKNYVLTMIHQLQRESRHLARAKARKF
ncbi:MAG: hypothetical protein GOU98_02270 [Candidatus Altiarchaeota archaeon]|nr:hypothetical protein [Candidatus Altiarchaeota archaeon]